jgi:hypothetical protein
MGNMTPEQSAHEARIESVRLALVAATTHSERARLSAEFYRLLSERDPELVEAMEAALMARIAEQGPIWDHAARCKLQAELSRQIGERDEELAKRMNAERLGRANR